jgi:heme-degrading monooxygenase HmoA
MIFETAVLDVIPQKAQEFEYAIKQAQKIISSMPDYIDHQLQKCMEIESRYLLLVK